MNKTKIIKWFFNNNKNKANYSILYYYQDYSFMSIGPRSSFLT